MTATVERQEETTKDYDEPIPLLVNDRAGSLRITAGAEQIEDIAARSGVNVRVISADSPDDARRKLQELVRNGAKRVAVAGGDGTIACAVQTLAGTDVALGIIAQGTANNFATCLRLPQDLPSAIRILKEGQILEVDLGRIGNTYFTESAGVGLFADALSMYDGVHKSIFRTVWTYLRVMLSARAHRMRLIIDGEPYRERAVWCEVANTFRIGYAVPVAPEAKVTDGKLDVVVMGDLRPAGDPPVFSRHAEAAPPNSAEVTMIKASEVRIESRHPMNVHCDDAIVSKTPVTITVAPGALKVLVDRL